MFDVLQSTQKIHRHHLIEASAGTGKTFTIENLVVRLLLEPTEGQQKISIEEIVVVTFTRAATRDLRERIRMTLNRIKSIMTTYLHAGTIEDGCPDYLQKYLETASVPSLLKKVEEALSSFDQAHIDTIHGFCGKMLSQYALESGTSLDSRDNEEALKYQDVLLKAIRDFLRTEISPKNFSPTQMKQIKNKCCGSIKRLQNKLKDIVEKGMEIRVSGSFQESFEAFCQAMKTLKQHEFTGQHIFEDFITQAPLYTGICTKDKSIKKEFSDKINTFANLFEKDLWTHSDLDGLIEDGLLILDLFQESKRSKKKSAETTPQLHYPAFNALVTEVLAPIVEAARNGNILLARLAKECQSYTQRILSGNDIFTYQDILVRMKKAIELPAFANRIRQKFRAAIVDEFQDTDPIQWEIFSKLFLSQEDAWNGFLFLVGDPKQSIYSFRQADIYTYLQAAQDLSEGSSVTLDTNFRSHPLLIEGLNTIFNNMTMPFPLPRYSQGLSYKSVHAGRNLSLPFSDGKPCIEFWLRHGDDPAQDGPERTQDTAAMLPKLIEELLSLEQQGIQLSSCAILVRDHFQSTLIEKTLMAAGIATRKQRGVYLGDTRAIKELTDILQGIKSKNRSDLIHTLTTRMIGWNRQDLHKLDSPMIHGYITTLCEELLETLSRDGFACFYRSFMASVWMPGGPTVLQGLLQQSRSVEFFREWQDLTDTITRKQYNSALSCEQVLEYLDELQNTHDCDEKELKGFLDAEDEGVMLMTTHVSKGLEFDVVFALGLMQRHSGTDDLIPVAQVDPITRKTKHYLAPVVDEKSEEFLQYQKELDAEKLRQLYVALTRAKYRVYVPVVFNDGTTPSELLVTCLGGDDTFSTFVQQNPSLMCATQIDPHLYSGQRKAHHERTLIPPEEFNIDFAPLLMQSFTSMSQQKDPEEPFELWGAPTNFDAKEKTVHTLPASNLTGILLHAIFENIKFEAVGAATSAAEVIPLIEPYVAETPYESWKDVVADIVYTTLKKPLGTGTDQFCLADVSPRACYRETPFMYSCKGTSFRDGIEASEGYIKGVIDLFFEHKGKYYLLDWKSNWLGPTAKDYSEEKIQEAMVENAYDVQADIYVEALKRYLRLIDPRPFDEIFGGTIYLFLRS